MPQMDRRQVIAAISATLGAALTLEEEVRATSMPEGQSAEKIFRGGNILTMADGKPKVAAVAVAGGRIIAAGDEADVMRLATGTTKLIELKGATLMPSFIDAHGHFMNAPQIVKWANVSGVPAGPVTSIADIITVLKAHQAKFNTKLGDWIIAYGYDMTNLSDGRQITRDDLDPHFPDNPVMLIHSSNHGAVLNSAGFKAVGIDASTKTPPGGLILRKKGSNEPEGLVMETAFLPIFTKMPQPSEAGTARHARRRPAGLRQCRHHHLPGRRNQRQGSGIPAQGRGTGAALSRHRLTAAGAGDPGACPGLFPRLQGR